MIDETMDFKTIQHALGKISTISPHTALELVPSTQINPYEKGALLEVSGQKIKYQFLMMDGIVRKFLTNSDGEDFTVDFFTSVK